MDNCTLISDIDPGGEYLLGFGRYGEKTGIYEVSTSDKKCISLLPGVATFGAIFARDGKSFLYAVASRARSHDLPSTLESTVKPSGLPRSR